MKKSLEHEVEKKWPTYSDKDYSPLRFHRLETNKSYCGFVNVNCYNVTK